MDQHGEAVPHIARRVRHFHDKRLPFRIYHGSTNSTRKPNYTRDSVVDTSCLTNVVRIDKDAKTALVEPNVSMGSLVDATLKAGLIPPIVMEFPGITVGGGFSGTSGESSSYKYGLFDNTITWIEIVLSDGSVVTASNSERADLFHGAAGSYGTLGVITLLEIQLLPAQDYVELTYHPVSSIAEAAAQFQAATDDPTVDFMDAIMYSVSNGTVMLGHMTSTPSTTPIQRFTRAHDPWFYLHAQRQLSLSARTAHADGPRTAVATIPLYDYLFRYDRGAFWAGRWAFRYFATPFNRFTRFALDRAMRTRTMYHALHESGLARQYIIQDMGVPLAVAAEFGAYLNREFEFYPVWLCPVKRVHRGGVPMTVPVVGADREGEMLLNFGVWGPGPKDRKEYLRKNREVERKIGELGGLKTLYAQAYYTEDEFWQVYDKPRYEELRRAYGAEGLPGLFHKVCLKLDANGDEIMDGHQSWGMRTREAMGSVRPVRGLYGVLKMALRSNYLFSQ